MSYLQFNDSYSRYGLYQLTKISDTLVKVENVAEQNFNGFKLYTINGQLMGDYSDYKYEYTPKEIEQNTFYYSSVMGYNIRFRTNGGGELIGQTEFYVLDFKNVTVPKVKNYDNFKFSGWSINLPADGKVEDNMTIIANFEYVPQLEDIQNSKIQEIEDISENAIRQGIDVELSDKTTEHFELSIYDQKNITNALTCANILKASNSANSKLPLYSKGNVCKLYPLSDIYKIYLTTEMFITYNLTLQHQLEHKIKACKTIDEVQAIEYDVKYLDGKYLEEFNKIINESKGLMNKVENIN